MEQASDRVKGLKRKVSTFSHAAGRELMRSSMTCSRLPISRAICGRGCNIWGVAKLRMVIVMACRRGGPLAARPQPSRTYHPCGSLKSYTSSASTNGQPSSAC